MHAARSCANWRATWINRGTMRGGVRMSDAPAEGLPDETSPTRDPRHVFLDARDVMRRYGWGKTKGYENLKDRDLVPPPVMIHPDRWRLDQLLAWEDRRIATAESELRAVHEPGRDRLVGLLPPPKRTRRKSA
jgi:hypothetical protein